MDMRTLGTDMGNGEVISTTAAEGSIKHVFITHLERVLTLWARTEFKATCTGIVGVEKDPSPR